jgi:sensor histidine kinase regulating citrate/malate metabolism
LDKLNYLEIIQEQRHSFLNHLQIISGLLQLNKFEQARDYVKTIGQEIAQTSKTSRIKIPQLALTLLYFVHEGAKYEVKVELDIESDFAECVAPGTVVGQVVEELIECVLEAELFPSTPVKYLKIALYEENEHYLCKFVFPVPDMIAFHALENKVTSLEGLLLPYAARIDLVADADCREVLLTFPRH